MNLGRLVARNLVYYWRSNAAVLAGVAVAVAVLSGALVVGDSVRGSLRDLALRRLGATGSIISSTHPFREHLGADIAAGLGSGSAALCPLIRVDGLVVAEKSGRRARKVEIYGVDDRFWQFHGVAGVTGPESRETLLGRNLARELQSDRGDAILIRFGGADRVPQESFFGRRDDPGRAVRLSCAGVLAPEQLGSFSVQPGGTGGLTAFVALSRLQRELSMRAAINTLLVSPSVGTQQLRTAVASCWQPADAGLSVREVPEENTLSVESPGVLLNGATERAALAAAASIGAGASPVYTYLATSIRCGDREIPYAVISAADIDRGALPLVPNLPAPASAAPPQDDIWLNDWAAAELRPRPANAIEITYFAWHTEGRLETETVRFRYAGAVHTGSVAGPSMAPDFPGITGAKSLTDWDPPFPFDLGRIRPADERYWDEYRTTPKAFIRLARGRALWGTRFGGATSVRVAPAGRGQTIAAAAFTAALMKTLQLSDADISISEVRRESLEASKGATDFGEYFLYFSFFLIAAALLLSSLFFKLGIEQRVREVGALAAAGFSASRVRRIFVLEATVVSAAGAAAGMPAALGYGSLMLHGLGTWWAGASGGTPLQIHFSWTSLATGAVLGIAAALAATGLALKGLGRSSPRALLSGTLEAAGARRTRIRVWRATAAVSVLLAVILLAMARIKQVPETGGFFGAGALLLLSGLAAASLYFRRSPRRSAGRGWRGIFRLGSLNAGYRPARSLSCVALIACATFVIVSLESFRQTPSDSAADLHSGTGGFALTAECVTPLAQDLNTPEGRESVGVQDAEVFRKVTVYPFRVKAGDDASCLNLYAPREPRVMGVPRSLIASGRFRFEPPPGIVPDSARQNPWLLLDSPAADGAIPAIADSNTIRYILHLSPGDELTVRGAGGEPVRLRLVAALLDSIFQSEVLVSESNFLSRFPEQQGFRFFLLDADQAHASEAARLLEEGLSDWGFDAQSASERLASFHQVENAYLSTFQALGGLGLLLGTAGMAAVLLRNVLERRKELGLLRAVGFPRAVLVLTVLAENTILVGLGLLSGTAAALVAVSPVLLGRANPFPYSAVLMLTGSVFLVGLGASALAAAAAFRTPLLAALRSE
jgi:putative ABC transport system permease protein